MDSGAERSFSALKKKSNFRSLKSASSEELPLIPFSKARFFISLLKERFLILRSLGSFFPNYGYSWV